jgi:hypothetical protein
MKEIFQYTSFRYVAALVVATFALAMPQQRELQAQPTASGIGHRTGTDSGAPSQTLLRVFAECSACEVDYLRQQLSFVNLVRDRLLADVHVLVTSLPSGSGGEQFSIELTGRAPGGTDTALRSDTTRLSLRADVTSIEQRELVVRAIKIGLLPFMRSTASWDRLDLIAVAQTAASAGTARGERDRWNGWVFRTNASGFANGDDNYAGHAVFLDVSANQVSDRQKVALTTFGEYRRDQFTLDDNRVVVAYQRSWSAQGLWVHSISDHLSAGALLSARSSLFGNTTLATRAAAAIEYNWLPYRDATQRQAVVLYALGVRATRYVDTTIFGLLRETRPQHSLTINTEVRQRWGTLFLIGEGAQYLHDRARFRVAVDAGFDWRITRGLTMGSYASYGITRDQLNIPGTSLNDEDRLLRIRELQSGSQFQLNLSASYTFGSLFNNVVNPRMRRF